MVATRSISAALAAIILTTFISSVAAQGSWKTGRASFYGLDGWSIHKGSCGLGYQWPDIYPGFDVAAIADASGEFSGSCGRCYEVKCRNADFTDGYGENLSRSSACIDPSASVVVRTVDNCPCNYPGNQYSNKRWCCGDSGSGSAHMDLSVWSFEKLASKNLGVIGIEYRQVPCDYVPSKVATTSNPSPPEEPWSGAKRPTEQIFVKRFDATGEPQGAVSTVDDASQANGKPIVPVTQLYLDGTLQGAGGSSSSSSSSSGSSSSTSCEDKQPTDGTTCQQQKDGGNCEQSWIKNGGYCQATCGQCSSSSTSSSSSDSSCGDKQPTDGTTCQQQKDGGNCEQSWIKNGGYCQATCGQCSTSSSSGSGSSSSSGCSDKQPSNSSCQQQKDAGNCEESWLKDGGYCQATCGKCQVQSFEG